MNLLLGRYVQFNSKYFICLPVWGKQFIPIDKNNIIVEAYIVDINILPLSNENYVSPNLMIFIIIIFF